MDLINKCIKCNNEYESETVQQFLFDLGYELFEGRLEGRQGIQCYGTHYLCLTKQDNSKVGTIIFRRAKSSDFEEISFKELFKDCKYARLKGTKTQLAFADWSAFSWESGKRKGDLCKIKRLDDMFVAFSDVGAYNLFSYGDVFFLLSDTQIVVKMEEHKMSNEMKLEDIKQNNLKEARTKFEEERKNAEVEYALKELRKASNEIDRLDREIKKLEEDKKPHQEVLDRFVTKK